MKNTKLFIIALVASCALTSGRVKAQTNVVPDQVEFQVLKDLYDSLQGAGWTNNTNWPTSGNWPATATSAQFNTWRGITVSRGDIININLSTNNLTGKIPSSIGRLTQLRNLFLNGNRIIGSLPSAIGNLSELTNLRLGQNQLTGSIPSALGNCLKLTALDLSANQLSGTIPSSLGLASLTSLTLSSNRLTGAITPLSNLNLLTTLDLSNNSFDPGAVPNWLFTLPALRTLYLTNTSRTGAVPLGISSLNLLNDLRLDNNFLTSIPTSIGTMIALQRLQVSGNNLSTVPTEILNLPGLVLVDLQRNNLKVLPNFATYSNRANLTLRVQNNLLDFSVLEPLVGSGITAFTYSQQNLIDDVTAVPLLIGAPLVLTARPKGSFTSAIRWEKQLANGTWQNISATNADALTGITFRIAVTTAASAGTYRWSCTSTRATGMTLTSVPIIVNSQPLIIASVTGGHQGVGGSITANVSGGTSPYTYSWSSGETTSAIANKLNGTYTLTVSDAANKTATTTYNLGYASVWTDVTGSTQSNGLLYKTAGVAWGNAGANSTNVLSPSTDGWIEFVSPTVSSRYYIGFGTGDVSFALNAPLYAFYLTETGQCYFQEGATQVLLGAYQSGDVFRISREGTNIKYYRNNVLVRTTATNPAQALRVKASLNSGYTPALVTSFDFLLSMQAAVTPVNVTNTGGAIQLTATGGVLPYTYSWSSGETTPSITNKQVGTYTITLTDAQGRVLTQTYHLGYAAQWLDVNGATLNNGVLNKTASPLWGNAGANSGNVLPAGTDGWLEFIAANSSSRYATGFDFNSAGFDLASLDYGMQLMETGELFWVEGQTSQQAGTWKPGDILRISREGNQIKYYQNNAIIRTVSAVSSVLRLKSTLYIGSMPIVLSSFDTGITLTSTILAANAEGTGGSIQVNSYGGVAPYTYSWSGGESTSQISGKQIGAYTVTVTDSEGRTAARTYTIGYYTMWKEVTGVSNNAGLLSKTASNGWGNGGANSSNVLRATKDGWIEFSAPADESSFVLGLATSRTGFDNTNVKYGIEPQSGSPYTLQQYDVATSLGGWWKGDVLRVAREGSQILFYKNGVAVRTMSVSPTEELFVKAILFSGSIGYVQSSFPSEEDIAAMIQKKDSAFVSQLPEGVKITREGKTVSPPLERQFFYNTLTDGSVREVFQAPPCLEGNYFVGFQLIYDLGDKQTTQPWEVLMDVTLLHGATALWTKPLKVSMKDQTFLSTVFHDQPLSCDGDYHLRIESKLENGTIPVNNVYLKIVLHRQDELPFDANVQVQLDCGSGQSLNWNYASTGATEFDVEWVYIADHENFSGTTGLQAFGFKEPARITLAGMSVPVSQLTSLRTYPNGRLWYRIRAVGRNVAYPKHRIAGQWSYGCEGLMVSNQAPDKNWQRQTVFAEEGKSKTIVAYADGTLRERQKLTNLSTEEVTLVGETLYDFEGRPAVQVLAVPSTDQSLTFKNSFNRFESQDATVGANTSVRRNKFHYDNYRLANSILSNQTGAGQYYSPLNPHTFLHKDYVPDANGYVYSQTEFTNDGTGRVKRQSGVGETFRMDGNHATHHFYGSPAQGELTRLFGSNVGEASHYKKNLVIDANGQVNVTYLDQEGRTIATALAGDPPSNVEALQSYSDLAGLPVATDISSKNKKEGNESKTVHKILNAVPNTTYTFRYSMSALGSQLEQFGCQTCSFDLSLIITSPDGVPLNLSAVQGNESSDGLSYVKKNITAADCSNSTTTAIAFDAVFAETGDYTVTKILTPKDITLDELKTIILQEASVQTEIQQIRDSYVVDASDCDICEQDCPEAEEAYDEAATASAEQDCADILQQIISDIQEQHPDEADYAPTTAEIQGHALYCQYDLCQKNQSSDVFDKQLSRVETWSGAVGAGYSNLVAIDPFFNDAALTGSAYKSLMESKLTQIIIGTLGDATFQGTIAEVTDPANTAFYVDANGSPDPNGRHLLYIELMKDRGVTMTEAEYQAELDKQRWTLYKNYYLDAKRKTKLEMPEYSNCAPARDALQQADAMPTTESAMLAAAEELGVTGPVDAADVETSIGSLTLACDVTFSEADRSAITNHLVAYFNAHPKNIFRLIINTDVGIDPELIAIESILQTYGCSLSSVALADPVVCIKDTIIWVPDEEPVVPARAMMMSRQAMPLSADSSATSENTLTKSAPNEEMALSVVQTRDSIPSSMDSLKQVIWRKISAEMKLQTGDGDKIPAMEQVQQNQPAADSIQDNAQAILLDAKPLQNLKAWENNLLNQDTVADNQSSATHDMSDRSAAGPYAADTVLSAYAELQRQNMLAQMQDEAAQAQSAIRSGNQSTAPVQRSMLRMMASAAAVAPPDPSAQEYAALMAIYQAFNGAGWTNKTGWSTANPNVVQSVQGWYGVTTDANGHITKLILSGNRLNGSAFPLQMADLAYLQVLDLSNNTIVSAIPDFIGSMITLLELELSTNGLTGAIPSSIGNLTNMQYLSLHNNRLTSIPETIGNLTSLTNLYLSSNQLTGSIPSSLGNCSNLTAINFSANQLSGSIPSSLGQLANLSSVILTANTFTGSIPFGIQNTSLTRLDVSRNQLTGSIPQLSSTLTYLDVSQNNLSGGIPASVGDLINLEVFKVAFNAQLGGSIPTEIGNLTQLSYFDAMGSGLTGSLPASMSNLTQMQYLDLRSNQLTGTIPSSLAGWANIGYFLVSDNHLEGTVPLFPGRLTYFWAENNHLSGKVPSVLYYFQIQNNNFTFTDFVASRSGALAPAACAHAPQDVVDVERNLDVHIGASAQLVATVDRSLANSTYRWFKFVDGLNDIALTPTFSTSGHTYTLTNITESDIGARYYYKIQNPGGPNLTLTSRMATLQLSTTATCNTTLALQYTALMDLYAATNGAEWSNNTGWRDANPNVVQSVAGWYGLTVDANGLVSSLDLGSNNLTGTIPASVDKLCSITSRFAMNTNQLSGPIPTGFGKMINAKEILLQQNQLTGEIPADWGDLSSAVTIHLGINQLSGPIPASLGNLSSIVDLALYSNQLTSVPASFSNLSTLKNLYLHDNRLIGSVPAELGSLNNLETLYLQQNQFSGSIPASLGSLSKIKLLLMNDNQLTGEIPGELGNLATATYINLGNNKLTGAIPASFGGLTSLLTLGLQNNELTSVPASLGNLPTITDLALSGNLLTSLPSALGNLTTLKSLYLHSNRLSGSIPSELGNLSNLEILYLSANQFTGSIPASFGNLTRLQKLYMSQNQLSGSIPSSFSQLTGLLELDASTNQLSGKVPVLPSAYLVYYSSNRFTFGDLLEAKAAFQGSSFIYSPQSLVGTAQTISARPATTVTLQAEVDTNTNPASVFQWFRNGVAVSSPTANAFTFTIPSVVQADDGAAYHYTITNTGAPDLTLTSRPQTLQVSASTTCNTTLAQQYTALMDLYAATHGAEWSNNTGWRDANPNVVQSVAGWYGITTDENGFVVTLNLQSNNLNGALPAQIGNLCKLENLYLSNNHLNGPLPAQIGNISALRVLHVRNSELNGTLPVEIGNLSNLVSLTLDQNALSGMLPTSLGNLTLLRSLDLSFNQLTGSIPAEFGNLINLFDLEMRNNNLSGSIPSTLGNLTALEFLDLSFNQLTGSIPSTIGNLSQLNVLNLGVNQLTGNIPAEIGSLALLDQLYLGTNQLTGPIPPQVSGMTALRVFHARFNRLTGPLPTEMGSMTNLVAITLDRNLIDGTIPASLGNLNRLRSLDLSFNQLSGTIPAELGNLPALYDLELQNNQLTGTLPASLGNDHALIYLILRNNQLSGNIPAAWSGAQSLEFLDLSFNQLSGAVPVELASLPVLSTFNLYVNRYTFADLLDFRRAYTRTFAYQSQALVDVARTVPAIVGSALTLTANVDRNTNPLSIYQWYRNGTPVMAASADAYAYTIAAVTQADLTAQYYYTITNAAAPQLTLTSNMITLREAKVHPVHVCLEYQTETENPTLQLFSFTLNLEQAKADCMTRAAEEKETLTELAIESYIEEQSTTLWNSFTTQCLDDVQETLDYTYQSKEYHYTLYYYDQSGSLVQTVPPQGVKPLTVQQVINFKTSPVEPQHELVTHYQYNSLGQLVKQQTPDAGVSRTWYNSRGQVRLSQNAQQAINNRYAYTKYDEQGRVNEVGEIQDPQTESMMTAMLDSASFPRRDAYTLKDVTRTHYDFADPSLNGFEQQNIRSRVSWVEVTDAVQADTVKTFYSYDVHGNVQSLLQRIPGMEAKRTDYVYDLVSGKINYVFYQFGAGDQLAHRYVYDADNRLRTVYTSSDRYVWSKDAAYDYYLHGPLARTEVGHYRVQGMDYYYTLQGWIKGVNLPYAGDPGSDGMNGSVVGKDAMAYTLGYFEGDYKAINNSTILADGRDKLWNRALENINHTGLYNGNISWMITDITKIGEVNNDRTKGMQAMLYKYDQLHRIKKSRSLTSYSATEGFAARSLNPAAFDEYFSYDANGNLLTLKRNDETSGVLNDFVYTYNNGTNQMRSVKTAEPVMFNYDERGFMTEHKEEGAVLSWTPYGKLRTVQKGDTVRVDYRYDGAGKKVEEKITKANATHATRYVRDAAGNIMSIYRDSVMTEQPIYGSGQLGKYEDVVKEGRRMLGHRHYTLSNHLGNVLTEITDNVGMNGNNVWATVTSARDYYVFGSEEKGRTFNKTAMRNSFNGKEDDEALKDMQDYGERVYLKKYGRFPTVDPITAQYPMLTPYQFSGNSPIATIDQDGLEPAAINPGTKALVFIIQGYGGDPPDGYTQSLNAALRDPNLGPDEALGSIFSTGPKLQVITYASSSTDNTKNDIVTTIQNFRSINPLGKVVLVGHSGGGDNAIELAKENPGLKINLLITLDTQDPKIYGIDDNNVPSNVENAINYFQNTEGIGSEKLDFANGTRGVNILSQGSNHRSIDNDQKDNVIKDINNLLKGKPVVDIAKKRTQSLNNPATSGSPDIGGSAGKTKDIVNPKSSRD